MGSTGVRGVLIRYMDTTQKSPRYLAQINRAQKIRQDAMTGDYSSSQLAERYGLAIVTSNKILAGTRCKNGASAPICARDIRTRKLASQVALYHAMGITYREAGEVLGLCETWANAIGLRFLRGEIEPFNATVRVRFKATGKTFDVVRIDGSDVMLIPSDDPKALPETVTIESLIGMVQPVPISSENA